MYGLPKQTNKQALDDIHQALDLQPTHLSTYQLTIEQNTQFYINQPTGLPDNDQAYEMQLAINDLLLTNHYIQYEISAHTLNDKQSQHNLNYWNFGDYIAIGAGAHGKLSQIDQKNNRIEIHRYINHRHPQQYLDANQRINGETPKTKKAPDPYIMGHTYIKQAEEIRLEFLMNALRLTQGCEAGIFTERTGETIRSLTNFVKKRGLEQHMIIQANRIYASDHAYQHLDEILSRCI
jgi:oxygen-independent coproporphyrinogen-3 oxidase